MLAIDKVRFVGEPVAAVVAEDEATAQEALEDILVDYEELPAVLTAEEALAKDAPLVHEETYGVGGSPGHVEVETARKPANICQESHTAWGDIEAAFARATTIVEGDFVYPMTYAYTMEPYVSVADYHDDSLTIYSAAQHEFMVRNDVADVFGLPLNRVRIISPFIGGGYGAKSYTKNEPLTAVLSWKAGRPVRLQLTVEESILTTRADDSRVHLRTAADEQGRVIARQATIYLNTGAYAENSPLVCAKTAVRILGPYRYEAVDITSYAVYTNTCPASSYRGFGVNQVAMAAEVQMDELAEKVGRDPVEFRLQSFADPGERFFPKKRGLTADVKGDLKKLAAALNWGSPLPPNHGRGVGVIIIDGGALPVGRSEVRLHGDGSVTVLTGSTELGQGSKTVLAQIAAEEFGVDLDKVRVVQGDTALTPFARTTGADRTTTLEGRTVLGACLEAKEQLRQMAAELWEADPADIALEPTGVMSEGRRMGWGEVIGKYFDMSDMEIIGRAQIRPAGELAEIPPFWEPGIAGVELEVDPDTGRFTVHKLVTVADIGLAINPATAEGQDLGSATMGLGVALGEQLVYEGQQLANGSILDYRVPRFSDVPGSFESILVENRDGVGPYGAKGMGDGPTSVMCAAISNAIYQAVGIRLHEAPFTPERVWQGIREGGFGPHPNPSPNSGRGLVPVVRDELRTVPPPPEVWG
jgi:CO/xanthine dehydrogenase Mo-binding subunit